MLRRQQHFSARREPRESAIACLAGGTLQAGTDWHLDAKHLQRHPQRIAEGLTMLRPGVGRSLKPMMDMHGRKWGKAMVLRQIGEQMQEDGGIQTTGERHAPTPGVAPGR